MKNLLLSVLLCTLFVPSTFAAKIAKVDFQKVILSVKQGKKVKSKLKTEFEKKQKVLKKEESAIRKMQTDYQKQSSVISDKARAKKEAEMQKKILALQQKSVEFQREIQELEQKLKKPIFKNVKTIVDSISKSGGYDMTFETATAPIFVKASDDITTKVISAYDKKFK